MMGKQAKTFSVANDENAMWKFLASGDYTVDAATKEQAQMAIDVCRELNLDFAGVDIMFGKEGEPVLCEVNSNAHFKNIYDCTGVNVAESILDYIVKSIKD